MPPLRRALDPAILWNSAARINGNRQGARGACSYSARPRTVGPSSGSRGGGGGS